MTKHLVGLALLIAGCGFFAGGYAGSAHAHGGVAMEGNNCVMRIGPYRMFFSGYQPEKAKSEAFCDDIPYVGKAIVVLDHVDTVLREMPTEFRILRDVNNAGITATRDDLGTQEDIVAATLMHIKPQLYPRGTFQLELDFPQGTYIGLVTVEDKNAKIQHVSVFPFSVGFKFYNDIRTYGLIGLVIVLVFGGLGYWVFKGGEPSKKTA